MNNLKDKKGDSEILSEVILDEMNNLKDKKGDSEINDVAEGRHYMVMMCQSWSAEGKSIHFMAARWCLEKLNGQWIRKSIRKMMSLLASYGFYVNGIAFDGATENRSAIKQMLTLTLRDLCPELLEQSEPPSKNGPGGLADEATVGVEPTVDSDGDVTIQSGVDDDLTDLELAMSRGADENVDPAAGGAALALVDNDSADDLDSTASSNVRNGNSAPTTIVRPLQQYKEDDLPWDMVMGMWHPSIDRLVVVACADMSHALKKMGNALENSGDRDSKRELELDGDPLSLAMLEDVWRLCPDADTNNRGEFICCNYYIEF